MSTFEPAGGPGAEELLRSAIDTVRHAKSMPLSTAALVNRDELVRLLEEFDSSRHRLLTDLLASYEFVPGTVFQAGHGSIFERAGFEDGVPLPNTGRYLTVSRGLFFKISYLYRF